MGFRAGWRLKSHNPGGRPGIDQELRDLVRRMCKENPLWGAPRIHGELLKLGFDIAQSTVSKYMLRRRGPPSQGWKTFLRNHADGIAAVDFLVVPTLSFERLFCVCHTRRRPKKHLMGHHEPDRTMVGPPDHRSLSMGHGPYLSRPRQ